MNVVCCGTLYRCLGGWVHGKSYSRAISGSQPTTTGHGDAQQRLEPRLPGVSVPLLCAGVAQTVNRNSTLLPSSPTHIGLPMLLPLMAVDRAPLRQLLLYLPLLSTVTVNLARVLLQDLLQTQTDDTTRIHAHGHVCTCTHTNTHDAHTSYR